ncbi:hypothetical protein [uncultured Kordia sp.]|uniref:hypothetical protein n=1 Tax=uncultured Kordia sp. TaxID=507699 RepID=UPI00262CD5E6|nr:hypothetical protein [uncultured Kordia sp.]
MKKILIFTLLGIAYITLFLSCETENQNFEKDLNKAIEKPTKIISNQEAITLFQNDQVTRLNIIDKKDVSFEDKAIHFDFTVLEKYFAKLEALVLKNMSVTGVSFVFGADNSGKRTVFLIPTTLNSELNYHEGFTIENEKFIAFKYANHSLSAQLDSQNDENLIFSSNGYLSFNDAIQLFNAYQNQYITPFSDKIKKEYYTKVVWYSLDELKAYMSYLKKKSNENNLAINGITIYFGVYENDRSLELKANAQTIFLMPSHNMQSIVNTNKDTFKEITQDGFLVKSSEESLVQNHGGLFPPGN